MNCDRRILKYYSNCGGQTKKSTTKTTLRTEIRTRNIQNTKQESQANYFYLPSFAPYKTVGCESQVRKSFQMWTPGPTVAWHILRNKKKMKPSHALLYKREELTGSQQWPVEAVMSGWALHAINQSQR